MEILLYLCMFILSIFGLSIASKIVVYCGTTGFYEARHQFFTKYLKGKEGKEGKGKNENIKRS